MEERGGEGATGAPRPSSPSREPTLTSRGLASPLQRHFVRREQGPIRAWGAEEVAELVRFVKGAGRTRGGRRPGTHPFRDLVHRAGRPRDRGPELEEGRWLRMREAALPGVDPDDPGERWSRPRMHMPRELLQREARY